MLLSQRSHSETARRPRQTSAGLPMDVPSSGGRRGVPEEVLDILLPARSAVATAQVLRAPNLTSLEDASRVRFLQGDGEAGVPSPEEQHRPPRT